MNLGIRVLWAHNAEALSSCTSGGDVDSCALLDEAVVELSVGKSTHHEFTVAHAAMLCNNAGVISKVLRSDAQLPTIQTREGLTLLHCAVAGCRDERMDVIDSLIAAGCSPTQRLHDGTTLEMLAAWSGNMAPLRRFYSNGIAYDNSTVLMAAAYGGHLDAIEYVLSRGESVHSISHCGLTALDHAALGGSVDAMRALMQRGAPAGWTKDGTDTLLVLASTSGRVDAIAFALDSRSYDEQQVDRALEAAYWSVDALAFLLSRQYCSNRAIEKATDAAALKGRLDSLRFLVMQHGVPLCSRGSEGLLHSALRSGNIETIQFVLDSGSFDVKQEDESCETSLLTAAAKSGNAAAMHLMYERGARKMTFGGGATTTLLAAAVAGSAEAMKFSISHGSHIDETDECGQCVLSAAVESGSLGAIKCAYDFGAVYQGEPSFFNPPPIFGAASCNNVSLMQYLLDEQHCALDNWDDVDDDGCLASKCARTRSVDALRFVLEKVQKPLTQKQRNATYFAALSGGSLDAMRLVQSALSRAQLPHGMNLLMVATRYFCSSVFVFALENGALINSTDDDKMTPLLHAADAGCVPFMRELVARGAKWTARDSSNRSLILHATSVPAVRFALECGCSIAETDSRGRSIIHHAAFNGSVEVMRLAMELGCSVDAEDDAKSTPLLLAYGWEAISFALENGACLSHRDCDGRTVFTNAATAYDNSSMQYTFARGAPVADPHFSSISEGARAFLTHHGLL